MAERGACPMCAKVAEDRHALTAHLEYSHQIADGGAYLDDLQGVRPRWWTRPVPVVRVANAAGLALVLGALAVGAGVLLIPSDPSSHNPSSHNPSSHDTASPDAAVPTVTTTASATGVVTAASPAPGAVAPVAAAATFRPPFVVDSRTGGCTPAGAVDRYDLEVTFSGAVDIVFAGRYHPGRSGDGDRSFVHEVPAGTVGYVDEIHVADAGGGDHRLPVSPPLYLPGC